jgi:predicted RNA polymerase sigma factor
MEGSRFGAHTAALAAFVATRMWPKDVKTRVPGAFQRDAARFRRVDENRKAWIKCNTMGCSREPPVAIVFRRTAQWNE